MKRILIFSILILGGAFSIKANEKEDSLNYYFERFSIAEQAGDIQDACISLKHTLRLYKDLGGDVSQDTVYAFFGDTYARLCFQMGDYETALNVETEVSNIYKTYGANHPNYAMAINNLALFYSNLGKYNEAIRLGAEATEIRKQIYGANHFYYATSLANLAMYYSSSGNYNEAIRLGAEALEIMKKVLGTEHPYYATTLNNLAECYSFLGNYDTAIRLATEALEIRKRVLNTDHPDYATTLNNLGGYYSKTGNYSEAIHLITEATEIRKRALGTSHPDYARSLNNLALMYSETGDYEEALVLGSEALDCIKNIHGIEHPDYATSLGNLALYYSYLGRYKEAIRLETEKVVLTKEILGTEHPDYAISLNNLSGYYSNIGNYNEAISLETEVMEISKRVLGAEHPFYAMSLNGLAVCYAELGNISKAIQLGTEAMEIRKRVFGEEHPEYALSLSNLAGYYNDIGNYNEAIQLETEALGIIKRVYGVEHPNYAHSLSNLASHYLSLGNYDEALRLDIEAKEIRKEVLGTNHPAYASSLSNLAVVYSKLGNFQEAINLDQEAVRIRKEVLGTEHPYFLTSLDNLACDYSNIGDSNEAIRLGTEAIEAKKRVLGAEHPDYAISLNNLASFHFDIGNYNEALRLGLEATKIKEKAFGPNHPDYATSLGNLALYYSYLGNYIESLPLFVESVSIIRNNVFSTFSGLTAIERLMYWNKYTFMFNSSVPNILISSGSPDVASVLYDNSALFAKGLLLSTELEMSKLIQENGDEEALQLYSELRQNRQMLNAQYSKPIIERYLNCDSLERVSNNLERQLVSRVKEFGDYTRNLSITWQDVQSKLKDNDVAIEFLSYPEKDGEMHYAALTLCKNDTAPILTPLFVESKLLEASGDRETYQTAEADSLVWGPLVSRLENKSHVYFSASGMLHNIGIEYLPSMDRKDCYRLSSTRELVMHQPSRTMRGATLYGDIDYDATYASIESSTPAPIRDYAMNPAISRHRGMFDNRSINNGVDALPSTRVELKEVSALMKSYGVPIDTLMGILASEESFKALSGQHRSLLHISTHGFYYNEEKANTLKPHLRQMLIGDDRPSYAEDKSLLRCGLCFAGANQALLGKSKPAEWQGDGILNALEIAQTDLRGLDLVVLSACQTALGDVAQGEGVFGLQRGFKKAGAQSILMSLWEVNDLTTQLLMTEFYKHYLSGQSKLESLKKAQEFVRNYQDEDGNKPFDDPYEWAGFILLDALD